MKFLSLLADITVVSLMAIGVVSGQDLPALPNDLCDYDTIYDSIRTGNVVEVTLEVRYRDCPANRDNKPCRASNSQGFAPGPLLNGVQTDNAIVINDEIPGPEIRAKLGDTIRVNIVNYLGEPTTMHFHGMTQFRTPFMDGDEFISNCPIATGHSHVYEFVAHPAGTTFYHSHSGSQRIAGMTGPLVIEDAEEPYADAPDRHVFIQDWSNQNSDSNFEFWGQNTPGNCITFGGDYFTGLLNPRGVPAFVPAVVGDGILFQSFIVNGQGTYQYEDTQVPALLGGNSFGADMQCPGQYDSPPRCEFCLNEGNWTAELCKESSADRQCGQPAVIEVDVGVETRLRVAHAGGLFASQVCIDGHTVDIIAADGSAVEPYTTDCFIIYTAERYDAIVKPERPGDYWIRLTTTEQQTAASFDDPGATNTQKDFPSFPNQGYAILRVKDPASSDGPQYRADSSPIACDESTAVNCGPDYWLTAKTMGCAAGPSRLDPDRCVTTFAALNSATSPSPNSDGSLCANANKKMAHEVEANVKSTMALGFIPDEEKRWEALSLSSRMEILMEDKYGFPFITPTDPTEWVPRQPISFINPDSPPLSLSADQRAILYAKRTIFHEPAAVPDGYPMNFSRGVQGPNALVVNYGDVVRIYFSCTEPYGPGCAMPHPMHLHGNKMAVLFSGEWTEEYDEAKFNPNPVYRDTVTVNTDSFTVIQMAATNPGVWRLHCHVNIHHRSGMAVILDVGGNADVEAVRATPESANLCPIQPDRSGAQAAVESPAEDEDGTEAQATVESTSEDEDGTEAQTPVESPTEDEAVTEAQTPVESPTEDEAVTEAQTPVESPTEDEDGTEAQTPVEIPTEDGTSDVDFEEVMPAVSEESAGANVSYSAIIVVASIFGAVA